MSVSTIPKEVLRDRSNRRLEAYGTVFQKTDRIVSGQKLQVEVINNLSEIHGELWEIAGWTDGEKISLNGVVLNEKLESAKNEGRGSERVLAFFTGVNYHELAHTLYTPRIKESGSLSDRVSKEANATGNRMFWTAFNALEDQRAELLFVSRFRASRHYFQAIALEYLLNDPAMLQDQYPLVHGRLWIPQHTRKKLAEMYDIAVGIDGRSGEFADIIDEYQRLVFPKGNDRGYELVQEYHRLLMDHAASSGYQTGHEHVEIKVGRGYAKDQDEAAQSLEETIEQLLEEGKEVSISFDEDFDADEGDGDGEDSVDTSGGNGPAGDEADEDAPEGGGSGDGESEDEADADSKPSTRGKGAGHNTMDDVKEALEGIEHDIDSLWDREDFRDDVEDAMETVNNEFQRSNSAGVDPNAKVTTRYEDRTVPDKDLVTKRRIDRELQDLRMEMQGYWNRSQPTGRVNVYDYQTRHQYDDFDVFDRWVESVEEEGGLEVILLIDASGSMGWGSMNANTKIGKACRAAWVLKSALEEHDCRVTTLTFNTGPYKVLYRPSDRSKKYEYRAVAGDGGTDPAEAIGEAARLFDRTDKPNRLLVVLTDGQVAKPDETKRQLTWLNSQGVITALVGVDDAVHNHGDHGASVAKDIKDVSELPIFVQSLVRVILMRLVTGR